MSAWEGISGPQLITPPPGGLVPGRAILSVLPVIPPAVNKGYHINRPTNNCLYQLFHFPEKLIPKWGEKELMNHIRRQSRGKISPWKVKAAHTSPRDDKATGCGTWRNSLAANKNGEVGKKEGKSRIGFLPCVSHKMNDQK